jgi:hypothetical protein
MIFPLYWPNYSPDIDIPLYLTGILFVLTGGLLVYIFLHSFLLNFSSPVRLSSSRLFLKIMIGIDIVIYALMVYLPNVKLSSLPYMYIALVLLYIFLFIIFFVIPHKLSLLFEYIDRLIDWSIIFGILLTDIVIFFMLLLNTHIISNAFVNYLHREETYLHFQGFSLSQYIFITIPIFLGFYLWLRPTKRIVNLLSRSFTRYLIDIVVLLIIMFLVSIVVMNGWGHPDYVIVPNYNVVMGPVNDVLGGKTLLVNTPSQYGLLDIYAAAFLFKFVPLTYSNFFWFNYVVMVAGYFLLYLIMRRWLGWIAILGIFLIIQHHYFGPIANILLYAQQTFLRWGWWIIMLLFIFFTLASKIPKVIYQLLECLLIGTAFYWAADAGTYLVLAYVGTSIVKILIDEKSWFIRIKQTVSLLLRLITTLTFFAIVITIFTYLSAGVWPDWGRFFATTKQFMVGLGLLPMPAFGPYILVLALYFGVLIYILYLLLASGIMISEKTKKDLHLVSFVTLYGISQFIYYTGRSTNGNLLMVILPFMVVFCWVLTKGKNYYQKHGLTGIDRRGKLMLMGFLLLFLLVFSTLTTMATVNIYKAYGKKDRLIPIGFDDIADNPSHKQAINSINEYLSSKKNNKRRVAIVSTWDGFFLIKTKSVNVISSNHLDYFAFMPQFKQLGEQLVVEKPDVIFTDHSNYYEMVPYVMGFVKDKYQFSQNVGYLDVWVKK